MKLFTVVLSLVCASAFAGQGQGQSNSNKKRLTFEQLKESCLNPGRFGNQNAPANIVVTCKGQTYFWEAAGSREFGLPSHTALQTSVNSNKYRVVTEKSTRKEADTENACPIFKQKKESAVLEKTIKCSELVAYTGTVEQFCYDALQEALNSNPNLGTVTETGRVLSGCDLKEVGRTQSQSNGRGQK